MMRIRSIPAIVAIMFVAACGGGTATSAPQSQAPASPASAAPASPASAAPASPASAAPASPASASAPAAGAACAPSDTAGSVAVKIANFAFDPATVTAKVGDTITWTNMDSTGHTATIKDNGACTTPTLAKDATGSITFSQAGTYDFFCKIHPTMTGTITVS
jgi:plastocyanin